MGLSCNVIRAVRGGETARFAAPNGLFRNATPPSAQQPVRQTVAQVYPHCKNILHPPPLPPDHRLPRTAAAGAACGSGQCIR